MLFIKNNKIATRNISIKIFEELNKIFFINLKYFCSNSWLFLEFFIVNINSFSKLN